MNDKYMFLYMSLVLLIAKCQPNFQERSIYLGPTDNVCHF